MQFITEFRDHNNIWCLCKDLLQLNHKQKAQNSKKVVILTLPIVGTSSLPENIITSAYYQQISLHMTKKTQDHNIIIMLTD